MISFKSGVKGLFLIVLVVLLVSGSLPRLQPVRAGEYTTVLYSVADTYVNEYVGTGSDKNYGFLPTIEVGYYLTGDFYEHSYSLIRFDLSSLPEDAKIEKAVLKLYLIEGGSTSLEVKRIVSPWNEEDVSWNNKPDTLYLGRFYVPVVMDVGTSLRYYDVDITTWVTGWFEGDYNNYGVMITPLSEETISHCIFYSKEGLNPPMLEITYKSTVPPPPASPRPLPLPEDTAPPTVEIEIEPLGDIGPDDTVRITARASDDVALQHVELTINPGGIVRSWTAEPGEVVTSCPTLEFSGKFSYGSYTVLVQAWDKAGHLTGESREFQVVGTGVPPVVTIDCDTSEVFPNDGTPLRVTVTANDPEGIKWIRFGVELGYDDPSRHPDFGREYRYDPPRTSVSLTEVFTNLNIPRIRPEERDTIIVKAWARDAENVDSEVASFVIKIIRPYQWDYGLPYENKNDNWLGWGRMVDVFGRGELRGPGGLDWWWTCVARFWKPIFARMAVNGECFGFCMYSNWHSKYQVPVPDTLTHSGDDLPRCVVYDEHPWVNEGDYVRRSIERWQGAQISQEILYIYIDQISYEFNKGQGKFRSFVNDQIPRIRRNIERGVPGVILMAEYRGISEGVMECVGAHAVVPWYVKEMSPGVYRIYVYDCNREFTSTTPYTDYDNFDYYPYIDVSENSFIWYQVKMRETLPSGDLGRVTETEGWNDFIWYISYEEAAHSDYDLIDSGLVATAVLIIATVGPAAVVTAVTITELLPIPIPIPMGQGIQAFGFPLGEPAEVKFVGEDEGEYSWAGMAGDFYFGLANKTTSKGAEEFLSFVPREDAAGCSIRFKSAVADDSFSLGLLHGHQDDAREYLLDNISISDDGYMEVYVTKDLNNLVIANYGDDPISMEVVLRDSDCNTQAKEKITVAPKEQVSLTDDWQNLGKASLRISRAKAEPPSEFDFTLSISPSSVEVSQGEVVTFIVKGDLISGTPHPVNLSLSGLPPDAKYSFDPPILTPSGSSVLKIITGSLSGSYTILVNATGAGVTKAAKASLKVGPRKCIIATVTYGSELSKEVEFLRDFRDNLILNTYCGNQFYRVFNAFYYSFSPQVAQFIVAHPRVKPVVKFSLYPLLWALHAASCTRFLARINSEVKTVMSGLIASYLIGSFYLTPALLIFNRLTRKLKKINRKLMFALLISLACITASLFLGTAIHIDLLTMFGSSSLVIINILLGASVLFETLQLVKRRVQPSLLSFLNARH